MIFSHVPAKIEIINVAQTRGCYPIYQDSTADKLNSFELRTLVDYMLSPHYLELSTCSQRLVPDWWLLVGMVH